MTTALLIRLRPVTPWRVGPSTGAREAADAVLHSDTLYSAVCYAFRQLGELEEWLAATAEAAAAPVIRFSSCFPMQRGALFVPPPAGLWPPATETSTRTRWHGARFIPLYAAVRYCAARRCGTRTTNWTATPAACCRPPRTSPTALSGSSRRTSAAVDRITGASGAPHSSVCLQFAPGSGLWCVAAFANPIAYAVWVPKLQAAFRLLADAGFGGMRSLGFGRARPPEFQPGTLPQLLLPSAPTAVPDDRGRRAWWLLSLFSPAPGDRIHWAAGDYALTPRSGRLESPQATGHLKAETRMVKEGSVLVSEHEPQGRVWNVAPPGCSHPVWKAGYALALPIPYPIAARSAG